jgi:hypothetical protein
MKASAIIFAGLDCNADAIEAWNRWYDLDHTPPNLAVEGVQMSRRYVALPHLHESRIATAAAPAYQDGRTTFVTIYTLCGDPAVGIRGMTDLVRDLVAIGRFSVTQDEKPEVVRDMHFLGIESALGDPAFQYAATEVPYLGHTAINVIQRHGTDEAKEWYRSDFAPRVVEVDGVLGIVQLSSLTGEAFQREFPSFAGTSIELDLLFLEGDTADVTERRRRAVPHHEGAGILVDAAFEIITPLRYPFAATIRESSLPKTVR